MSLRRLLGAVAALVLVLAMAHPALAVVTAPNGSDTSVADPRPNSLPGPNSGAKPTQPGDRGGALQFATFGLMCAGLTFIGWRIVAASRRARRLSAAHQDP